MADSLVLFIHISAVLALFAGLAVEAFGAEAARKTAPRVSGIAMGLILLSGFFLGARYGVLGNAWLRASYAAIVAMAAVAPLARRSEPLRQISLRVRVAFGLAIVFLMVAKPDGLVSLIVLGVALTGSTLVGLPKGEKRRVAVRSRSVL
jgi:hypothetical protein